MRTRVVIILVLFLAGCDGFGLSSNAPSLDYDFHPERPSYTLQDTIRATFTNRSDRRVYLFRQDCIEEGLQRRADGTWKQVVLPIVCTQIDVPHTYPLRPRRDFPARLVPWMLEAGQVTPGTYRLMVTVGFTTDEGDAERAVSAPFEILPEYRASVDAVSRPGGP